LLRRREEAFGFACHFYQSLSSLFQARHLFILKNYINLSCRTESLSSVTGGDSHLTAEEAWTKKILKQQEDVFSNTLILKVRSPAVFAAFNPSQQTEERERQDEGTLKLGFFSGF